MAVAKVCKALGDSTRLEMVSRLSSGSSYTITTLSAGLPITRQGARKHLQILVEANLVSLSTRGRDVEIALNTSEISHTKEFFAALEKQWDSRLQALKRAVEG